MRLAWWMVVVLGACGDSAPPVQAPAPDAARTDAPPSDGGLVRIARVLETRDGGGYTFARMDACGQEAWVAGPPMSLAVGNAVEMRGGAGMTDFRSEALGKTFDAILFVDAWKVTAEEPVCAGTGDVPALPDDVRVGKVIETMDASGYTYAKLDVCGTEVWVAAPEVGVTVGSFAATPLGSEMKEFKSAGTERTFDSIWFVQWIKRSRIPPVCDAPG